MKHFGILGHPLNHTFSPDFFRRKIADCGMDAEYSVYDLPSLDTLPSILEKVDALNVTSPYKEEIIRFMDTLDPVAKEIGAVNLIHREGDKWVGYNTDWIGFRDSLPTQGLPIHTMAMVLGTGGASKAVLYALSELGIEATQISREARKAIPYSRITPEAMESHRLIINCTPLGMTPDVESCPPIPYGEIGAYHYLYDLIYNPAETRFLALGREQGARTQNGRRMLELQAEEAWRIIK